MADTRVQLEVEDWVRTNWMPANLDDDFFRERIALTSGGVFDFDAVSRDRKIAATISTSGAYTASGKRAAGKVLKIRSDLFFLILADVDKRLAILTEQDMFEFWATEAEAGRVPSSIEFLLVDLPNDLREKLEKARRRASKEVSPRRV